MILTQTGIMLNQMVEEAPSVQDVARLAVLNDAKKIAPSCGGR